MLYLFLKYLFLLFLRVVLATLPSSEFLLQLKVDLLKLCIYLSWCSGFGCIVIHNVESSQTIMDYLFQTIKRTFYVREVFAG
jgi:hypothetical protein